MNSILMSCGCRAQGTSNGKPVCTVHFGILPGAEIPAATPDLKGRQAKCPDCAVKKDSSVDLPFFTFRPAREMDSFYCGCRGWD